MNSIFTVNAVALLYAVGHFGIWDLGFGIA
jgi:hypothetical protein